MSFPEQSDPAAVGLPEIGAASWAQVDLARAARPDAAGGDFPLARDEAYAVEHLFVAVPEPDALEGQVVAGHIRRGLDPLASGSSMTALMRAVFVERLRRLGSGRDEGEDGPVDAGD